MGWGHVFVCIGVPSVSKGSQLVRVCGFSFSSPPPVFFRRSCLYPSSLSSVFSESLFLPGDNCLPLITITPPFLWCFLSLTRTHWWRNFTLGVRPSSWAGMLQLQGNPWDLVPLCPLRFLPIHYTFGVCGGLDEDDFHRFMYLSV